MNLDLDTIIFISFLTLNLIVGLFYSRGIITVREYAIGNKTFSTQAIAATLISTVIGAGFFSAALIESYRQGLRYIIPAFAEPIALIITGIYLVPRMKVFLNDVSIAETMGKFYGKSVQLIVAVSGIIHCVGVVALQFKVAISIMGIFFDLSSLPLAVTTMLIVTGYSAFGGMKAVTFTDILQFFTFGIILPMMCMMIWRENSAENVYNTIINNPLLDFKQVFSFNDPYFFATISLFLFFAVPTFQPVFLPRISMAKDIAQAKRSHILAGAIIIIILFIICWTSILLLSNNPDLDPNSLLPYIINNYSYTGLKGLAAIGIMAIIMSTADSYINSGAVLFVHDVVSGLNIKPSINKLLLLRASSWIIGLGALCLVLDSKTILKLLVGAMEFYMPIVTVPIILLILGFRSSQRVVLLSMLSGLITVIFWSDISTRATMLGINSKISDDINAVAPAMLANLLTYIIAHLISGKPKLPGGVSRDFVLEKLTRQPRKFFVNIKNFSFIRLYKEDFANQGFFYVLTGFFGTIYIFSMSYLATNLQINNLWFFDFIYFTALLCSFILIIYPILPSIFKREIIVSSFRVLVIPYILFFVPLVLSIISKFEQVQVTILLLSVLIFVCIVRWKIALAMAIISLVSIQFFRLVLESNPLELGFMDVALKFKLIYIFLITITTLIAFLKPKQEAAERAEEIAEHLSHVLDDQKQEITNLTTLKQVFLRNLEHETNTPVTGIYSMSQALGDCYDKLTDEQRKNAIATITTSSERLISYVNNLIGVSKLTSSNYKLKIRQVNLSNLLEESLRKCRKLYVSKDNEDDREFIIKTEPNLIAECDEYYIRKCFENLIINSIQYCKKGVIEIQLQKEHEEIKLTIQDSGIGIPTEDLTKIFDPFVTSGKTLTPAGGRGMGLTLVKAVAESHKGTISVKSTENAGSSFAFVLPQRFKYSQMS